ERRDRAFGETREVFLFLRVRPEHLERLRDADRLMRRKQRRERAVDRRDQLDGFHVRQLRQSQPAVLAWNLDPERAEVAESLNDALRDFALAVDLVGIDVLTEEAFEFVEEGFGAG